MIYFIVNPIAGHGKAKTAVPIISDLMREMGVEHNFIYSTAPSDSQRVAALIDKSAATVIACVGGDGTVQDFLDMTLELDLPLGIIPAGSANDLLYSLPEGKKRNASFKEMISYYTKKVVIGKTIHVDAVSVNRVRSFLNIGGIGIDIQVLEDALPIKRFFGGGAYFLSLVKNAMTYKAEDMTLTIDGRTENGSYLLLSVCNGAYYGGHMHIAPSAVIDDGLLTLCIVRKMPRVKLAAMFPLVKPGWHINMRDVSFTNCSSVSIEFEGERTVNLDGNLMEFRSPLRFEILKAAVRLIV